MCWGAFCSNGVLELEFISTHMDAVDYQNVLQARLLPFLRRNRRRCYKFQQDNASVHTFHSTMQWFSSKKIQVISWPSCSPDLNPIENIWGVLPRRIYANNTQYATMNDLKKAIVDAWDNLEQSLIDKLISSMPDRLIEVASKKGGPTHY